MFRSPPIRDRLRSRPRLEALEDRKLLYATLGASFAYGSRIAYSFVPDGTDIGGDSSTLFSTLAARGFTTAQWQAAFQKAAAVWEAAANINLALVSDDGSSFCATGNQQDDSRFGDIRIGGAALSPGTLATCFLPPPINGGSLAGDVVINTTQAWQINTDYDLQTVAIHEFGHALGLDHSLVSTADMYASYNAMKQSLTGDDTAGIQAVWGARRPDPFDAVASNNAYTTASNISPYITTAAQATIAGLDITNSVDVDWYVVTAPVNASGSLTVTMQSSGLSSLSPKVVLYSGSMATLSTASAANVYGATVTTSTITGVLPGQKFYIKCGPANGGTSGIGAYGLEVNFASGSMNPVPPPNTVVASVPDHGGGSSNEGIGDLVNVVIGNLSGEGDSLRMDPIFARALNLVTNGLNDLTAIAPPLEKLEIRLLLSVWHAAEQTSDAPVVRAAVIQAIDDVLTAWEAA